MKNIDPVETYIFTLLYVFVARKHADDDPFAVVTFELVDDFQETLYGS
jgi:hypothetical protein